MLEVSTREPSKSRVVFLVCSRGRYTRNPSLDIYLLSVKYRILFQVRFGMPGTRHVNTGYTPGEAWSLQAVRQDLRGNVR